MARFKPAPDIYRCKAVVYRGGFGYPGRCVFFRCGDPDFCKRHQLRRAGGLEVKKVTEAADASR